MGKPPFFNLDLDNSINWHYWLLHFGSIIIWVLGIWLIVFRGDLIFYDVLPEGMLWIPYILPLTYLIVVLLLFLLMKWYYLVILLLYPLILFFWLIPKLILKNGKIYLLAGYANFLYKRIKSLRLTIIYVLLFFLVIVLLIYAENPTLRIFGVLYFTCLYSCVLYMYVRNAFHPLRIFGTDIELFFDAVLNNPERSQSFIIAFEQGKPGRSSKETKKRIALKRLVLFSFIINHIEGLLTSVNVRRVFLISWVLQSFSIFLISILFFSVLNYQLFLLDHSSFFVEGDPSFFLFVYYTIKTFAFSTITSIYPIGFIARTIEVISYLLVGIFFLAFFSSFFIKIKQERINQGILKFIKICKQQNNYIAQRVKSYGVELNALMKETSSIAKSVVEIKKIIEKLL